MKNRFVLMLTSLLVAPLMLLGVLVAFETADPGTAGAGTAGAGPSENSLPARPASPFPSKATAAAPTGFWTPERMASALPIVNERPAAALIQVHEPASAAIPREAGGYAPADLVDDSLPRSSSAQVADTPQPSHGSYPGPHATYPYFGKYRRYPISPVSKMFFSQDDDGNGTLSSFVCSASATYGGSYTDVIWTAGHCVHNGRNGAGANGGYSTNIFVCPSYDNGVNPAVGCWSGVGVSTSSSWYSSGASGQFGRDYGIVLSAANGTVKSGYIVSTTGGYGFAWNWGRDQEFQFLGYPSSSPWTGGKIVMTSAEERYEDGSVSPAANSIGSGQTPGASGSPWLRGGSFSGTSGNINSNYSYYYTSQYGIQAQGPYFDTTVCNFWKSWTGWSGTC